MIQKISIFHTRIDSIKYNDSNLLESPSSSLFERYGNNTRSQIGFKKKKVNEIQIKENEDLWK